jgi:phosphonopyruvate decarboxylase
VYAHQTDTHPDSKEPMRSDLFTGELKAKGFSPFMGVPCSVFKSLINFLENKPSTKNYLCSSEGEAMGLAGGFSLSGRMPVVYMQNDGYGNTINPLSSLQLMYKLPALLLISWRAEPGKKDAPQHKIMGETIRELLALFKIPYEILVDDISHLKKTIQKAARHCKGIKTPFAFIIKKGYFEKLDGDDTVAKPLTEKRIDYIKILAGNCKEDDILLGATGFSGRELYQTIEHKSKFYMMGSMGCLGSIGLGISLENPDRNVYVLDGDGALLMKMGTLSTIGYYQPPNLIHICFDNQSYESTGGQPTTSSKTDFPAIARACGYNACFSISRVSDFKKILKKIDSHQKPLFIHIKVSPGTLKGLERPATSPEEMRDIILTSLT